MASSFRPGSDGHCGGAIYFAMSPEERKLINVETKSDETNSSVGYDGCYDLSFLFL